MDVLTCNSQAWEFTKSGGHVLHEFPLSRDYSNWSRALQTQRRYRIWNPMSSTTSFRRSRQCHAHWSFNFYENLKTTAQAFVGAPWWASVPNEDIIQTPSPQKEKTNLGLLLQRFWEVAIPYWKSEDKIQALFRALAIILFTLASTAFNVRFSFLNRNFFNALASKNRDSFVQALFNYLGTLVVAIPVFIMRDYTRREFALQWRAWMSKFYLQLYFKNRAFYRIQHQSVIDNPDQRIVDDLDSFSRTAITFALSILDAIMDLVSFSAILYHIYPPLFAALLAYSVIGTSISINLGKDLVQLNQMQEKWEADCRYALMRIRENAESIAFYAGEFIEMNILLSFFGQAFKNTTKRIKAETKLKTFKYPFGAIISLLPSAVVAPLYFAGKIEMGVITQSETAFYNVYNALNIIVSDFEYLCSFSAVIHRLGEFFEALEAHSADIQENNAQSHILLFENAPPPFTSRTPLLQVENLSLQTPCNDLLLVRDLSFVVHKGDRMLITGISGCGKTSLLRAIAGLWKHGTGTIQSQFRFRKGKQIFFCPQKPYMVLGTLRQQLLYPLWHVDGKTDDQCNPNVADPLCCQPTDMKLLNVLQEVHLEGVAARYSLESKADWSSVLSLGEQQRIAFARILLCQPKLVLLDEATSALDEQNEAFLYKQLQRLEISIISVGHRTSLRRLHTCCLRLNGDGANWDMMLLN